MKKTKPLAILLTIVGVVLVVGGFAIMVSSQDTAPSTPTVTETVSPTAVVNLIPLPSTISGIVKNEDGNVANAIVQIQATENTTKTVDTGAFTLSGIEGTTPIVVSAWSEGHYVGWQTLDPSADDWDGGDDITIFLNPLPTRDNSEYDWFVEDGVRGAAACGMCHREYPEWQQDAHSGSATNVRFLSVYTGTDAHGDLGQVVQFDIEGNPLPPDPDEPYYGPGFRLDNPSRSGNCATCHTPAASKAPNTQNCAWAGCHLDITVERANGTIDRNAYASSIRGKEGITCEFCHKIGEVYIDEETNIPFPDNPGILSYRLYRPFNDDQQVFFGPLVDVQRQDSYSPLISTSDFCAGCHYGVFGGVVGMERVSDGVEVYTSYSEWQASPYNDPETGKTCQDCHMPISSENWFVSPEKGGITRDYLPLHNHTMRGVQDVEFMQNAVIMETTANRDGEQLNIEVSITNDNAGHHVPTDVPTRSMMLVIEVTDDEGTVLDLVEGSVNPDYTGDYDGTPGKTFAKVLEDQWTGESPTVAFWRPVEIIEDTRIPAMETDTTSYSFSAPENKDLTINVQLIFRRSFYELMQQKGWGDADIIMEQETIQIPTN
jgi:hypothetical protein